MTICNCKTRCDCTIYAIIASVIAGIIAAFLRITAVITVTSAFLWVVLGIAVGMLGLNLLASPLVGKKGADGCVCTAINTHLIAILATILMSVVLLAVSFATTSVYGAVLTGILIAAFFLTVTSAACYIKSILSCGE